MQVPTAALQRRPQTAAQRTMQDTARAASRLTRVDEPALGAVLAHLLRQHGCVLHGVPHQEGAAVAGAEGGLWLSHAHLSAGDLQGRGQRRCSVFCSRSKAGCSMRCCCCRRGCACKLSASHARGAACAPPALPHALPPHLAGVAADEVIHDLLQAELGHGRQHAERVRAHRQSRAGARSKCAGRAASADAGALAAAAAAPRAGALQARARLRAACMPRAHRCARRTQTRRSTAAPRLPGAGPRRGSWHCRCSRSGTTRACSQ